MEGGPLDPHEKGPPPSYPSGFILNREPGVLRGTMQPLTSLLPFGTTPVGAGTTAFDPPPPHVTSNHTEMLRVQDNRWDVVDGIKDGYR
ncbi:hypothetical protein BJ165DRAFT_1615073 [Panaeolus papilionaceus]|nr:hypothetical protein BJ165DRAFT_1615073 [Panaeolus papilionaceus]